MNKLPKIEDNFAEWYQEVVYQADLADQSPTPGCIVIKPYGFAIWENIRDNLDARLKSVGCQNAYFPLLIPESFLKKEAEHVEGFAPEIAVVTYAGGKKLEEPLIIRPTSETVIHYMFSKWIKSWRDLPLRINQWANVVRWEMRPRPFLRSREFLWHEAHAAYETLEDVSREAELMLQMYTDFVQNELAIPVIPGVKSESETFAGAEKTFTIESFMQDGRAIQMGTTHILSQDFAKAFNISFQNREGVMQYPYLASWGMTTRLIGAIVMCHGDNKGLIIPPRIAPIQVVIVPIWKNPDDSVRVLDAIRAFDLKCRAIVDADENSTPGAKFYKWELKGVPLRIEIGVRDLEKNEAVLVNRLTGAKKSVSLDNLSKEVDETLVAMQIELFNRAYSRLENFWIKVATLDEIKEAVENKKVCQTGFCGNTECEAKLKEHKASIRCLLKENTLPKCFNCGKPSKVDVLVAKSY